MKPEGHAHPLDDAKPHTLEMVRLHIAVHTAGACGGGGAMDIKRVAMNIKRVNADKRGCCESYDEPPLPYIYIY